VREAIQQSIARILVGVDGALNLEAEPKGLLGLVGTLAQLGCRGTGPLIVQWESPDYRRWKISVVSSD